MHVTVSRAARWHPWLGDRGLRLWIAVGILALGLVIAAGAGAAEDRDKDRPERPERGFAIYTDYSGVSITPAAQALVGDYSVGLAANGEKASSTVEMRVTVKARQAWGWIGVGMIIGVIGGLGGLFAWLGRR